MAAIHVLDDYYLAITLLVTIAYQLLGFSIAYTFKFDKLTGTLPPYPTLTPTHLRKLTLNPPQTSQAAQTSSSSPSSHSPSPPPTTISTPANQSPRYS